MKQLFTLICVVVLHTSYAQYTHSIYQLTSIPQSTYINPSSQPACKWYIGFPAISSLHVGYKNSAFHFSNLVDNNRNLDIPQLVNQLGKNNFISLGLQEEWVSFGFKVKENYFSFNLTEKIDFRFDFTQDMLLFPLELNGNRLGETIEFGNFKINATHYREMGIGYSRKMSDKLRVGGRVKMLYGLGNFNMKENNLSLYTGTKEEMYRWEIKANQEINASLPIDTDYEKAIKGEDDSTQTQEKEFKAMDYILNSNNLGFGLDAGVNYKVTETISVFANILDFGYIRWNTNAATLKNTGEFIFEGVTVDLMDSTKNTNMDHLLDSIADQLVHIEQKNESYSTMLNTSLIVGAAVDFSKSARGSAILRTNYFNQSIHPALTLSFSKYFGRILGTSISYTMANRSYNNIGVGLTTKFGPWQMYVAMDNVSGLLFPEQARQADVLFGMNFVFGCKDKGEAPVKIKNKSKGASKKKKEEKKEEKVKDDNNKKVDGTEKPEQVEDDNRRD